MQRGCSIVMFFFVAVGGAMSLECVEDRVAGDAGMDAIESGDVDADAVGDASTPPTWLWRVGSLLGRQYATSIAESEDGGVYVGGFFEGLDSEHLGMTSGWIARLDRDGEIRWEILVGEYVRSVAPHPSGGIVAVFSDQVLRVTQDGAASWQLDWQIDRQLESSPYLWAVEATARGTFILAASLALEDGSGQVPWIGEMSGEGELLWQRTLSMAVAFVEHAALGSSSSQDILAAYQTREQGALIARLDRDGGLRWARHIELDNTSQLARVDIGESTDGDVFFISTNGGAVLVRLGADGTPRWQRLYQGSEHLIGNVGVAISEGSVLLAGGRAADGDWDLWIASVDRAGELEWQAQAGMEGCEIAYDGRSSRDGSVLVAIGGCLHTFVAKIDPRGTWAEDCSALLPAEASPSTIEIDIRDLELTLEPTYFHPVTTSVSSTDARSVVDVFCG